MLIAQITDTHIVEKSDHYLSEPTTETPERLSRVIGFINQLKPLPDLVILSGDATDNGTEGAYAHLKELLQPLKPPCYLIPGNHDRREALRTTFHNASYLPKTGYLNYCLEEFPLRLIGLDTLVEGEDHGAICPERFAWLEKSLSASSKPTLIFMHHPPLKIGMKLFDSIRCVTPPAFETLIASHPGLIGMVMGHYHHLCITSLRGKLCFLAPSTAPVHLFSHPEADQVAALELEEPAVTLHRWQGEQLVSQVYRVKKDPKRIDWALIEKRIK